MANTPRLDSVSPKRQRIAELARQAPEMVFTSLAHYPGFPICLWYRIVRTSRRALISGAPT